METQLVYLVLLAALLHAIWNAMAKSGGEPAFSIAGYQLVGSIICAAIIPFLPTPAPESWIFIFLSVVIHNVYYFTLAKSYQTGDLSLTYPLFRGLAPVLVAVGAGVFAGEWLSFQAMIGVGLISLGLAGLTLFSPQVLKLQKQSLGWALLTAIMIASYTIVDGLGVRASGNAYAYIAWLFLFESWPICLILLATRKAEFTSYLSGNYRKLIFGGTISSLAYALVIFAMSLGAMAMVSSLRETSVIFAAIIGAVVLKESFGKQRILGACLVAAGIILLRVFA